VEVSQVLPVQVAMQVTSHVEPLQEYMQLLHKVPLSVIAILALPPPEPV
jgi:hypothetical protein